MQTPMPTRITIELEPQTRRGTWRTRTLVEDRARPGVQAAPASPPRIYSTEPEVTWTPEPYEPHPCTCEEGLCDRDHEHE
jgi:hypothetical protein